MFLQSLAATFQTVLIVPGNEEYPYIYIFIFIPHIYNIGHDLTLMNSYYSQQYSMQEVNEKISSICQNHSNVIFLNNKSVVIGNTEFIGSTISICYIKHSVHLYI